ncbi:lipoyltransferase 1, mitochondrial [Drosophila guanche]|uniref:Blast:Lipoyltransferase 1, mitochondrial n=1 Tax=Drosophila guanche TaxID=7266 RepID=A0A3B0JUH6_DROGU|nr:lipoyltransferase 1, mitochondrial [Drosophila guanche]SPP74728.1 blast:Lipoyltransferase 1%2C mitochondrial [Drosophila guanche]
MSLLLRRNSSQLRLLLASGSKITRLASTDSSDVGEPSSSASAVPPTAAKLSNRQRQTPPAVPDAEIKKSVFISQSNDIFTNLALEDWLYKNFDFGHHHVLLLWANDPCVVIGRHQNPFTEANVSQLVERGITLARRNSGGGAVYHDRGNLNCTFFTPRERYDRKYNLNIVTRALFREWAIKAEINERDDIVIRNKKISGTAAKLGHPNSYHHCTILASANKLHLGESLVKEPANYISRATASVPSPIRNLVDVNPNVNVSQLLSAVGYEYLRTVATALEDGGNAQTMQQRGFQLINPTEKWFPGIEELRSNYSSWDWVIGKTPKFTVEKDLELKGDEQGMRLKLTVEVDAGLMKEIGIKLPHSDETVPVVTPLQGKAYNEQNLNGIMGALKLVSASNVKQAMNGSG